MVKNIIHDLAMIVPCHRKKERCLSINGKPMLICARCFAMLLGYLFIPLLFFIKVPFLIGFICQIPMLIDGITQLKGLRTSNNTLRFITGLISGFGLSILVVSCVKILISL